jgi:hypothetical protein
MRETPETTEVSMPRAAISIAGVVLVGLACGVPAAAEGDKDRASGVFDETPAPPKVEPKPVSKAAQRKRAALQQRLLLEQQQQRGQAGSVAQSLERLRREQAETLRLQQYGPRYQQRHMPQPAAQPPPSDAIGQRLDALRQQQSDTLRDQRQIQSQQRYDTQQAIRGLRN